MPSARPLLRRSRAAACAAACAAVLALPAGAEALEPGFVTDMTWYTSAAEQDRTAAGLKDTGSRMVRLSISWRDAEPTRGSYNNWWLEEYDGAIARAQAAGQRVLIMLNETPEWASASGAEYAPPRDNAEFAAFARFIAERYAGKGVEAYEVWNEPNFERFWSTGPNAAEYTRMLRASYPAIKAGDPQAKVVFAGPSLNDWRFIEAAYAAGAKGSFDVMATHPYACTRSPSTSSASRAAACARTPSSPTARSAPRWSSATTPSRSGSPSSAGAPPRTAAGSAPPSRPPTSPRRCSSPRATPTSRSPSTTTSATTTGRRTPTRSRPSSGSRGPTSARSPPTLPSRPSRRAPAGRVRTRSR